MHAWAGIAIAQVALLAFSLRRVWRLVHVREIPATVPAAVQVAGEPAARTLWLPGLAILVVAALAMIVFVGDGGGWAVLAMLGTAVLAADQLLLDGVLVASLCTRDATDAPEAP